MIEALKKIMKVIWLLVAILFGLMMLALPVTFIFGW